MNVFLLRLVVFYIFLNESFKINIEDERHHVRVLEFFKFKNIFGFVAISIDTYLSAKAKGIFQALVFLFLLCLIPYAYKRCFIVFFRLTEFSGGEGNAKR